MLESLRAIPGFTGYLVSSSGVVHSQFRLRPGESTREIKAFTTPDGYRRVRLRQGGGKKNILVHRAVALAWLGEPPSHSHEVNHIDGVKSSNNSANLEWVTRSENLVHAARLGLRNLERGDSHPSTRMTDEKCSEAFVMLRGGAQVGAVAAHFGVHRTTILNIRNRQGVSTARGNYKKVTE